MADGGSNRGGSQRRARGHRRRAPRTPVPEGHLAVGKIVGAHGLRGEIKVELHTDYAERFAPGTAMLLGAELEPVTVIDSRQHKGLRLVYIAGVEDRFAAEELRGEWLFIPESEAMELDEDTFWVHQIVGLSVFSEADEPLGTVADVLFTGANDVYVIKTPPDVNRGRDLLVPALADVIRSVDLENRRLIVRLLPGMLDE